MAGVMKLLGADYGTSQGNVQSNFLPMPHFMRSAALVSGIIGVCIAAESLRTMQGTRTRTYP